MRPNSIFHLIFLGMLLIIYFISSSNALLSQSTSDEDWTTFTPDDGLASNAIFSSHLDSDGAVWVGTNAGLTVRTAEGNWLTFDDADGLGGNIVSAIKQDRVEPDKLWVATSNGLSLLDHNGTLLDKADDSWITFHDYDGLINNSVSVIALDSIGQVWIGTNFVDVDGNETGYGLSVLNPNGTHFDKSDDQWRSYTTDNSALSNNIIHAIAVSADQVTWVGTANGLNIITSDDQWSTLFTGQGLPSNNVTALQSVGKLLWIGTKAGLSVRDDKNTPHNLADDQWTNFSQSNSGLIDNDISSLAWDKNGYLFVGTSQKASGGDAGYGFSVLYDSSTPFAKSDDYWRTFNTASGLSHNAVRSLTSTSYNTVWAGTREGLSSFAYGSSPFTSGDDTWRTYTSDNRLMGPTVQAIAGFYPILLGTNQGLSLLNHAGSPHEKADDIWLSYTVIDGLPANNIKSLAVDKLGRIWIGTASGLAIVDMGGTPLFKSDDLVAVYNTNSGLPHNQVNDIYIDSLNRGWLATGSYFGGGLFLLDPGPNLTSPWDDQWTTFTENNSALPNGYVTSLAGAKNKGIWIGTFIGGAHLDYGVSPYNKSDDSWSVFQAEANSLSNNQIRAVALDPQTGAVWFGLADMGIDVFHNDNWMHFSKTDGLSVESVYALSIDAAGRIWIGTDGGGLSILDINETLFDKADDTWVTISTNEQLASSNVRALFTDTWGQTWSGTFGGGVTLHSDIELFQVYLPVVTK